MTELSDLPLELIRLILKSLDSYGDRSALARTRKAYYEIGLPIVFESLTFIAPSPESMFIDSPPKNLLRYVKHIEFLYPDERKAPACFVHTLEDGTTPTDVEDVANSEDALRNLAGNAAAKNHFLALQTFTNIKMQVCHILSAIPEGKLESFRWHFRFCIPKGICGKGGILPTKQRNLKELSIATGPRCGLRGVEHLTDDQIATLLDLTSFNRLVSIVWKGSQYYSQWTALRKLISRNHSHLRHLSVDSALPGRCTFSGNTRHLIRTALELSSLQSLSLRAIRLDRVTYGVAEIDERMASDPLFAPCAFNSFSDDLNFYLVLFQPLRVPKLQSLSLIECTGLDGFIECFMAQDYLPLKRLEVMDREDGDFNRLEEKPVPRLAALCENLEELYLLFHREPYRECGGRKDTEYTWKVLNIESLPLRRLVYHERAFDDGNVTMTADWIDFLDRKVIKEVLSKTKLECLGICDLPQLMPAYLYTFRDKSSLKVIHVRRTFGGADYEDLRIQDEGRTPMAKWTESKRFDPVEQLQETLRRPRPKLTPYERLIGLIKWVFGYEGIHSVELVAYGDFSNEQKYRKETLLYIRNPENRFGYKEIDGVHLDYTKIKEPWKDFLSRCPCNAEPGHTCSEHEFSEDDSSDDNSSFSMSDFLNDHALEDRGDEGSEVEHSTEDDDHRDDDDDDDDDDDYGLEAISKFNSDASPDVDLDMPDL